MRRYINNLISVVYSFIRMSLIKIFHIKNFSFYPVQRFSPNVVLEIRRGARVSFGKKVRVHSGCKIKACQGGELVIGDNVKINYNCIIACLEEIQIGEGTEFGPAVYVYDHDHDYRIGLKKEQYRTTSVKIGKNCWIGANSIILRGTELGDNCIVAAGSVVKGKYPSESLLYQKREIEVKAYKGDQL